MSEETERQINQKGHRIKLMAAAEAIKAWNTAGEKFLDYLI